MSYKEKERHKERDTKMKPNFFNVLEWNLVEIQSEAKRKADFYFFYKKKSILKRIPLAAITQ